MLLWLYDLTQNPTSAFLIAYITFLETKTIFLHSECEEEKPDAHTIKIT